MSLVTRCPYCDTSFRVTDEQLRAADGAVRCGACLAVFTATDHLVEDSPPDGDADTDPPLDETLADEASDDAEEPEELTADEDLAAETDEHDIEDDLAELLSALEEEGEIEIPPEDIDEGDDAGTEDWDDEEFEAFLSEEMEDAAEEDPPAMEAEGGDDDTFKTEDDGEEETSFGAEDDGEHDYVNVDGDADERDSWPDAEAVPVEAYAADVFSGWPGESPREPLPDGELDVETPPEELIGEYEPPVNRHYVAWIMGCLALLAVLAVQLAWFNRDLLAQNTSLRGYCESVCNVLGCSLPVYRNMDEMHVARLMVRSDPAVAQALEVDAIIRNDARWRQYFPDLRLKFSDVQGDLVAERTFKPADYLAGEMTGVKFIPARTEVRISLRIVDPGPDATNYTLTVAP